MTKVRTPSIFTIPAGVPFARALAAELLRRADGKPEALAPMHILLPTRRACRIVREAFLRESNGAPLLLPRLQPLGDVDEEEITLLNADDALALPPAMPPLQRRILLAHAIMHKPDFRHSPAHALALADALSALLDRIHTENLDIAALPALAGDDFAAHWQVTLDFLKTLTEIWPSLLENFGMIDAADRRNRLLNALAAHWQKNPPSTPVIAAGSTGSIPATARLLKVIAGLPQGAVILPGLDQGMDGESWDALDDTHPQATLKNLLEELGVERRAVKIWPGADNDSARRVLAAEIMRPAATAECWSQVKAVDTTGIMRLDAAAPQEEAKAIALLLRETLETPGRTAALVTPDRLLARRVAAICARWDIAVDDSAGQPLLNTPAGSYLRLCAFAAARAFAPVALLSLLRHGICAADMQAVSVLEHKALRGPKPPPGIEGLRNRLAQAEGNTAQASALLDRIASAAAPMGGAVIKTFAAWLDAHIAFAETLAGGADHLWRGEDGEAAALFLSDLRTHADALPEIDAENYLAILEQLMQGATVRPKHGLHPRLFILGQLEARLLQTDLVILGGLNEGTWPPDPGHDPWMSRPMMKRFGLPAPERAVGLAAHDFVQGFCAPHIVLTRSERVNGAPAVPARWLQRLDTVLQAAGIDPASIRAEGGRWLMLARTMDVSSETKPFDRPRPAPSAHLRPQKLSVTEIETWMNDPYGIYAKHVLRLKKLKPLEKQPDAADRGTILHDVLHEFVRTCPAVLPADAGAILRDLGENAISRRSDESGFWDFWRPRFARLADWMVGHERDWRAQAVPLKTEIEGKMDIGGFTLTARADRIDKRSDGTLAVIDYKSGGVYTKGKIKSGAQPQLPLEALMLQAGAFTDIAPARVSWLGYILLTGGDPPGKIEALDGDIEELIEETRAGLESLIARYRDEAMPYFSLPDPARAPRYNDYEHLARVQEWAALDDTAEAA